MAGGYKLKETAADLSVALALFSVKYDIPLKKFCMALGEIGLTGEILPVSKLSLRLKEAVKMNFTEFVTRSALDKPIIIIDGLDKVLKEQKAIGRNLNQLTMLCNMGKIVCPDLSKMVNQYSAVYDRLNDISGRCK